MNITDEQFFEISRQYAGAALMFLNERGCDNGISFSAGGLSFFIQKGSAQQMSESLHERILEAARTLVQFEETSNNPKVKVVQ